MLNEMKRSIKNDELAVSPVIGVILMVAITVALAVTVFVLVGKLSHGTQNVPATLSLEQTRNGQTSVTYTVLSTDIINYNALTVVSDGVALTYTHAPATNTVVTAGDTITITGLTTGQVYNINFVYNNVVIASMTYRS